ncbi:ACR012Cp [Eremothecium gossypii ATCC 10895]|uniref:ACR012Cp n=1 Tax=Eremothecium gossypii (strain ATCC 10895 / CBS 109.51 / FGSC 9923 / NRRL Y-1056) TaxID=284811 RepID=Q75CA0_EREGS|nr:ACR012Cp [Eremothecium gossypii ATCC 10895]AAS51239.1 ACR012Cp [Eremothecium gossypii ATCC 10895]
MKLQRAVWPAVALTTAQALLILPQAEDELVVAEAHRGQLVQWMARENQERKAQGAEQQSPLFRVDDVTRAIPHKYIVVFREGVSDEEAAFHMELVEAAHAESVARLDEQHAFFRSTRGENNEFGIAATRAEGGIEGEFALGEQLRGYVGYFTEDMVGLLRSNPHVHFVEEDSMVFASDFTTQNGAPWGLARVSHREKLNSGSFNKYLYDDNSGEGVTSYVIDTGINIDHVDFEDRALWGKTIPNNDADYDGNGHGTHCAGTIASKTYGVAKKANVVAVKVLRSNGTGSMSDVLRGVEYAVKAHRKAAEKADKGFKGSTANMSLGGGRSQALDLAVDAAVDAGIHFAVAAGNENQDACNTSPAASQKAITVGASTLADDRAYFSNWGRCVDLFAPGMNILSTYIGSDTAVATLSGTSMASPHVAGLLTYFLSLQPDGDSEFRNKQTISPEVLKKKVIDFGTKDALSSLPARTANVLIYNGGGADLSDFWGNKPKKVSGPKFTYADDEEAMGSDLDRLIHELESSTDAMFSGFRTILDRMNII